MKGVFVFCDNGGGELLAFDMREPGIWPIICYDPISGEGSVENVASSSEELLPLIEEEDA